MPAHEQAFRGIWTDCVRSAFDPTACVTRTGAGLAALGLGAAGGEGRPPCAPKARPPADEPAPVDTPGIVTPQRAAGAVERLPALAETILQQSGVPGMAVAVVHDDALTFTGGFGVRELGKDAAVDADTVFQLASVSKSLAATVVSSVVGDGIVAWESRMADLAPGFALHDAWPT
jgi:CubicO group peptidase (beta-lactamase class C family)